MPRYAPALKPRAEKARWVANTEQTQGTKGDTEDTGDDDSILLCPELSLYTRYLYIWVYLYALQIP